MAEYPNCPKCKSEFTYELDGILTCPECFYEWTTDENSTDADTIKALDANGKELKNGDVVVVIKDLPVKGALRAIKSGTKVKNIRIVEGDHNIDCKIEGFGSMALKSEFVKKA